jgi:oligopeptide transport system substrate-binding protein
VPDDYTLVLETVGPTPYLIQLSLNRAFRATPREAVSRRPRRWTKPEHIVTSGPFHLTEWLERDHQTLVKSPTYWDAANVRLEKITSLSINDQAASTNMYFYGDCDATTAGNVPTSYMPAINGENGKKYSDYHVKPYLGVYIYLINTQKHPNRHFRRALAYAVNRQPIPGFLHGGQIATAQYMPGTPIAQLTDEELALCGVTRDTPGVASVMIAGELCYVPPPGLDFDPEKARAELELARKELGAKMPKKITVKFNTGVESHKLIAEYMQQQWKQILGLEVELESQEWKTFLADTRNGEFDVARMGWIGNFPDVEAEFLPNFKCKSPDNRTKYCSEEFERFMRLAENEPDRKQRLKWAWEAERTIVEDAPLIPMYVYAQQVLRKPYVRDLAMNLMAQIPFNRVWIDPDWENAPRAAGEAAGSAPAATKGGAR